MPFLNRPPPRLKSKKARRSLNKEFLTTLSADDLEALQQKYPGNPFLRKLLHLRIAQWWTAVSFGACLVWWVFSERPLDFMDPFELAVAAGVSLTTLLLSPVFWLLQEKAIREYALEPLATRAEKDHAWRMGNIDRACAEYLMQTMRAKRPLVRADLAALKLMAKRNGHSPPPLRRLKRMPRDMWLSTEPSPRNG